MIFEHPQFYLPNLYTFQNQNAFYGSFHGLRFLITPTKQDEQSVFDCQTWYGEFCLEESEVVDRATFPMNETGYQQVLEWLDAQYHKMVA